MRVLPTMMASGVVLATGLAGVGTMVDTGAGTYGVGSTPVNEIQARVTPAEPYAGFFKNSSMAYEERTIEYSGASLRSRGGGWGGSYSSRSFRGGGISGGK